MTAALALLLSGSFGVLGNLRITHASLRLSSPHVRGVAAGVRLASAIVAVAAAATLAVRPLGSFGVLSIASLTHRYGSAVLTRGVAAGVRVASAILLLP